MEKKSIPIYSNTSNESQNLIIGLQQDNYVVVSEIKKCLI